MGSTGSGKSTELGIKNVTMPDGTEIELEDALEYGTDAGKGRLPQTVTDFENKRRKAKIEYSLLTLSDGTEIESNRGGSGSVKSSLNARLRADILTHNHPRKGLEAGLLGGTFSAGNGDNVGDITNFVHFNQKTLRAVAGEGTYSITKGANFDGEGLLRAFIAIDRQLMQEHKKTAAQINKTRNDTWDSLRDDLQNGKIDTAQFHANSDAAYEDGNNAIRKSANSMLVKLHNWLLDNQTKYGYTYGLER